MGNTVSKNLKNKINNLDFDFLDNQEFSEIKLKEIAQLIVGDENEDKIIYSFLEKIPNYGKNYDWNIGSIFQHISPIKIFTEFKKFNPQKFLDSIGLSWVFGEFNLQDEFILNYLYDILNKSKNTGAWWRAGFSIGKIKKINSIALLKNSLKSKKIKKLDYYLNNLDKETSIIGILLNSNKDTIKEKIYPALKIKFLNKKTKISELINCIWLIGRLNLIDTDIYNKVKEIIKQNRNYQLIYYTFFAIQENISELFLDIIKENISHKDPLIRKMAIRGLSNIPLAENILLLEDLLIIEEDEKVLKELTKGIYRLKNIDFKKEFLIFKKCNENENGQIIDESDKWYGDPSIYNIFSEAEDPENVCFNLIKQRLINDKIKINNPIDIACGTGRSSRQILNLMNFKGKLFSIDINQKMVDFLKRNIDRRKDYVKNIEVIKSEINEIKLKQKSSFIISTFGFPSKIFDQKNSLMELKKIYSLLEKGGVFITIGWDETFNDELNYFWYKFLPDDINANGFEEWRIKRRKKIMSPRNCNLSWYKKGLAIPLQFSSLEESAYIMGHLFGRDALEETIKHKKVKWVMSMGVTYNTKEELKKIINNLEKNERN